MYIGHIYTKDDYNTPKCWIYQLLPLELNSVKKNIYTTKKDKGAGWWQEGL